MEKMKTKKILSVLLVALMAFAVSGFTAFAADEYKITVDNSKKGETYAAYKVFDVAYAGSNEEDPHAYTISDSSEWWALVTSANDKTAASFEANGLKFTKTTTAGVWNVEKTDSFDAAAFATLLYKADKTAMTAAASKDSTADGALELALTEPGYYFVNTTLGALCAIDTTHPTATIKEKNTAPTVEKKVADNGTNWADSQYAQIGDTVSFQITVTDGKGTDKAIVLVDTMDDALTFTEGTVKVDGSAAKEDEVKVAVDGQKITFTVAAAKVKALDENGTLVITYDATVNAKAVAGADIKNAVKMTYSKQTAEDEVTVKTNSFGVFKFFKQGETKTILADASFQLLKDNAVVSLVKVSDTEYRVAYTGETGVEEFVTVAAGNIVITGVDSDAAYALKETEAPAGYNKLTEDVAVNSVAADNTTVVEVENKTGTALPATGAMGTTLFYAFGIFAILAAGVFMVTNKRIAKEEF